MIRDVLFDAHTKEAAEKLAELCRAEGWSVHPERGILHLQEGVATGSGYVPEDTFWSVCAQVPDFDYSQMEAVHDKAEELAKQTETLCVGGGCAIGEEESEESK